MSYAHASRDQTIQGDTILGVMKITWYNFVIQILGNTFGVGTMDQPWEVRNVPVNRTNVKWRLVIIFLPTYFLAAP